MQLFESIILGLVQGLTEFLPVSSSGHLVIFQKFLGVNEPGVTLEIILHFGTLLSVFTVFGRDIINLLHSPLDPPKKRFLLMLAIGVIPTGAIGLALKGYVDQIFSSVFLVGAMLIVTGGLLKFMALLPVGEKDVRKMKIKDALLIGLLQGVAIIPGISRSGATITAAIWRGLDRDLAVRYSFMISIPVILGATLLEAKDLAVAGFEQTLLTNYFIGGAVAFLSGVMAIKTFIKLLKERKFDYFAYYCWAVGLAIIIFSIVKS